MKYILFFIITQISLSQTDSLKIDKFLLLENSGNRIFGYNALLTSKELTFNHNGSNRKVSFLAVKHLYKYEGDNAVIMGALGTLTGAIIGGVNSQHSNNSGTVISITSILGLGIGIIVGSQQENWEKIQVKVKNEK